MTASGLSGGNPLPAGWEEYPVSPVVAASEEAPPWDERLAAVVQRIVVATAPVCVAAAALLVVLVLYLPGAAERCRPGGTASGASWECRHLSFGSGD